MSDVLVSIRPKWCEKICHEIGKTENGKPIYEKRIEVRKTAPKEVPFKAYIYATKPKRFYKCGAVSTSDELLWSANGKIKMCDGFEFWADSVVYQCLNGKVIGEFVCDYIYEWHKKTLITLYGDDETYFPIFADDLGKTCLTHKDLNNYGKGKTLYGWHISDLKIYDKPKDLSEFYKPCPIKEKYNCYSCDCLADNDYGGVCTNNLTRPPQSWCYVEELK